MILLGQRSTLGRFSVRACTAATAVVLAALVFSGCSAPAVSDGTQNTTPLPTATVAAPNGGSIDETVAPADPAPTQEAELGKTAELSTGVDVTVSDVKVLDVTAETPGEIAGPAVALTISVSNASAAAVDLSTAMVTVTGADGSYGQATSSQPFSPFAGSVGPGQQASGVYVFRLPADERTSLQVTVEYIAGAPIALFVGSV